MGDYLSGAIKLSALRNGKCTLSSTYPVSYTGGQLQHGASYPDKRSKQHDILQLEYVRRCHWGRYFISAALVAVVIYVAVAFAHGQIEWHYVGRYLVDRSILIGLLNTIVMTVLAMTLGGVLGVTAAVMRLSANPVASAVAYVYVWLFRGTPVILQLLLWYNLALVFPSIGISGLIEFRTVDVMTPFLTALLGLGINQGAYTSEVVRSGLLSVPLGSPMLKNRWACHG